MAWLSCNDLDFLWLVRDQLDIIFDGLKPVDGSLGIRVEVPDEAPPQVHAAVETLLALLSSGRRYHVRFGALDDNEPAS